MNSFLLQLTNKNYQICSNIKMIVFDMAGTTVNEQGIVYKTLYDTIKSFGLNINKGDIDKWHGANKYEVLQYYLEKDNNITEDLQIKMKNDLYQKFNNNLKDRYFSSSNIKLIDNNMPELFNNLRKKDIKITLNTGYSQEIQESIISKLHMKDFIDDYISSDLVSKGRPEPFMIQKLMEKNRILSPNNIIKIGDTPNDILEGKNANCLYSIGVLSGADCEKKLSQADYIINNIMDIKLYN